MKIRFNVGDRVPAVFNGHLYEGKVLRQTPKRDLVKFTTGTGRTRERWFPAAYRPELHREESAE